MISDQFAAFISYASADHTKALEICESLETRGLNCWMAPRNIRAGHEYGDEIIHGIQQSRCLVLVLSDAANESPFVRREVERAVSKRKPVFPIRIEEILPSPALELFVSATHWIDAWNGRLVDHLDQLARDLTDESVVAHATRVSEKAARRREMPRWILAGVVFAGVVCAIVLGNHLSRNLDTPPSSRPVAMPLHLPPVKSVSEIESEVRTRFAQHQNEMVEKALSAAATGSGKPMALVSAPAGVAIPSVYLSFPSRRGLLQFVPLCPPDTSAVKYSFDEGGYFTQAVNPHPGPTVPRFVIEEWKVGSQFRLSLESMDGRVQGPFLFEIPAKETFVLQQLKANFVSGLSDALQCALIPAERAAPIDPPPTPEPEKPSSSASQEKTPAEQMNEVTEANRRNGERAIREQSIRTDLEVQKIKRNAWMRSAGYLHVDKAPCVVCAPKNHSAILNWAAVKEVRVGSQSGHLDRRTSVNIDWKDFLTAGSSYFAKDQNGAERWQIVMPAETETIYARFIFRDGSETEECRYRVDTIGFASH